MTDPEPTSGSNAPSGPEERQPLAAAYWMDCERLHGHNNLWIGIEKAHSRVTHGLPAGGPVALRHPRTPEALRREQTPGAQAGPGQDLGVNGQATPVGRSGSVVPSVPPPVPWKDGDVMGSTGSAWQRAQYTGWWQ